jgi:hypothetical protein
MDLVYPEKLVHLSPNFLTLDMGPKRWLSILTKSQESKRTDVLIKEEEHQEHSCTRERPHNLTVGRQPSIHQAERTQERPILPTP